jgi:hypothetical protein
MLEFCRLACSPTGEEAFYAAWSPDGKSVYYVAKGPLGWSIRSVPVAGGTSRLLVRFDDPTRQPIRYGFSTDGRTSTAPSCRNWRRGNPEGHLGRWGHRPSWPSGLGSCAGAVLSFVIGATA